MAWNQGYVYREELGAQRGETALAHWSERYRHSTVAEWEDRFARGEVTLDGVVIAADAPLRAGQILCWHRPPWEEADTPQTFGVVHEDAHVLGIIKPSGLPTVPAGGFLINTLLHRVRLRWPEAIPMHRLGRATSGLVLFARTRPAASELARAWREGRVEKHYRTLASGQLAEDRYEIDAPIGLVPHLVLGSVHGVSPLGKPARSTARVLERRADSTLLEVQIHTGRAEQIRIHLASLGHPLSGDPLYGPDGLPRPNARALPGDGGYLLHAHSLVFPHPGSQRPMRWQAEPEGLLALTP